MRQILNLPRAWVLLCILHSMGRLLRDFVNRETVGVTPSLRQDVQVFSWEGRADWSAYAALSRNGEETANFFEAWPDIARCLGIRSSTAKYKAVANMWDLLQAVYCTYQGPNSWNYATVAKDFRRYSTVRTASWYLRSLEHEVDAMLPNIGPSGVATFCGALSESINRFLKHGHENHSNRGGGSFRGRGWMRCKEVNGRPPTGQCARTTYNLVFCIFRCVMGCAGGATVAILMLLHGCYAGEGGPMPHASFPWTDSSSSWPITMPSSWIKSWRTYFAVCSSVDLGKRSNVDLGSAIPR